MANMKSPPHGVINLSNNFPPPGLSAVIIAKTIMDPASSTGLLGPCPTQIFEKLFHDASTAYSTFHSASARLGVAAHTLEQQVPVLKWALLALATGTGLGAGATYLYGRYKARQQLTPPIPIPDGEDPQKWYLKARGVGAFLKLALKKNKKLRDELENVKEEIAELKEQETTLQEAVNSEAKLREKKEIELERLKKVGVETSTPSSFKLRTPSSDAVAAANAKFNKHHPKLADQPIELSSGGSSSSDSQASFSLPRPSRFNPTARPFSPSDRHAFGGEPSTPIQRGLTASQLEIRERFRKKVEASTPLLMSGKVDSWDLAGKNYDEVSGSLRSTPLNKLGKRKMNVVENDSQETQADTPSLPWSSAREARIMELSHRLKQAGIAKGKEKLHLDNVPKLQVTATEPAHKRARATSPPPVIRTVAEAFTCARTSPPALGPATTIAPAGVPSARKPRLSSLKNAGASSSSSSSSNSQEEVSLSPRRTPRKTNSINMNVLQLSRLSMTCSQE